MTKLLKYISILLIISIFAGCTHKAPVTNRSQMILMSQSQELALGERSYNEVIKKSKVITNTWDSRRIKRIGQRIANVVDRKDFNWEFNLIDNKEKNAFCLPGGKVAVYTGILEVAKNDDQLATVISHEIAHALARHGAERVSTGMVAQGVQLVGNIVLGTHAPNIQTSFNIAYGLGTQYGVLLPYGRLQENEADEIGIHLMYKAGYNINEAVNFWQNMSGGHKHETIEFFSTHPNSSTRMKNIRRIIADIEKNHPITKSSTTILENNNLGKRVQ